MAAHASRSVATRTQDSSSTDALRAPFPSLLPYNRKLRNLRSISLRNLDIEAASSGRPRGLTIDDDGDPRAFASPNKLRALREERVLEHSLSSGDLRQSDALAVQRNEETVDISIGHGSPTAKSQLNGGSVRKRSARPRRRSTLDWANANALRRQEKLEHVKDGRMANIFYSLHIDGINEPVYISETAEQTMDPTYRSIELFSSDAGTLRQNAITIRFWIQSLTSSDWSFLHEWHVRFESLQFLATEVDRTSFAYEKNTLLFSFTDGVYTLPSMMPFSVKHSPPATVGAVVPGRSIAQPSRTTSTFDALLKLAKLTDSIEDALSTRDKLASQLDKLLLSNKAGLEERDRVTEHQDRCKTVVYARDVVTKQISKAKKQLAEKRAALQRRRTHLTNDQNRRQVMLKAMKEGGVELVHQHDEKQVRRTAISAQERRIAEDLSRIYPVNSIAGDKTLAFSIRGLRLPNAEELDNVTSTEAAASLGLVAQVVQLLSFYLHIPLPYHLHVMGSTSWIVDPISIVSGTSGAASAISNALRGTEDKAYPLHQSRVARFRFYYGVFLLNKDIQLLLESRFGVRVLDIRHTLPNLKYLLYLATAGEGQLPARKAGGVRGLVRQTPRGSLSRDSSAGSNPGWKGILGAKEEKRETKDAAQSLRQFIRE